MSDRGSCGGRSFSAVGGTEGAGSDGINTSGAGRVVENENFLLESELDVEGRRALVCDLAGLTGREEDPGGSANGSLV